VPEAEGRMDGKTKWRGEQAFRAESPSCERMIGWSLEGIERLDIEGRGDVIDDVFGPMIQRQIWMALPRLVEYRPDRRSYIADDRNRRRLDGSIGNENFVTINAEETQDC